MFFIFKQAVCLEGKDYSLGAHELSGKILKNETFKKFCEIGWIVESEKPSAPLTEQTMNLKIVEKMAAPKEAPVEVSDKKKIKSK